MRRLGMTGLVLVCEGALAHPGHGLPGWIHPHLADAALLLLGLLAFLSLGLLGRKATRR